MTRREAGGGRARERAGRMVRYVSWVGVVGAATLLVGCGGGGTGGPDKVDKTKVTGTVPGPMAMGVQFVPIVDGKEAPTGKDPSGTVMDGKYEVWVAPGKYAVHILGADATGPKVMDVEIKTGEQTVNITKIPAGEDQEE